MSILITLHPKLTLFWCVDIRNTFPRLEISLCVNIMSIFPGLRVFWCFDITNTSPGDDYRVVSRLIFETLSQERVTLWYVDIRKTFPGVDKICIWYPFEFDMACRWHSDKSYRTSRRRVRYGLSECHLNPYRTRMDIICIFAYEITLNLSFTTKKPPLQTTECDMASDQNCA